MYRFEEPILYLEVVFPSKYIGPLIFHWNLEVYFDLLLFSSFSLCIKPLIFDVDAQVLGFVLAGCLICVFLIKLYFS